MTIPRTGLYAWPPSVVRTATGARNKRVRMQGMPQEEGEQEALFEDEAQLFEE